MLNRALLTFLCAAESGSFTAASEKLNTTPASVMHQVNNLEWELGLTLFERRPSGVSLTSAGRLIYDEGKRLVSETEAVISRAKQVDGKRSFIVRVGTSLLNPVQGLTELREKIDDERFQIKIVPFEDDRTTMLSVISSLGKKFDFLVGPCGSQAYTRRCRFLILGYDDVCVAVARSHRLAGAERIAPEDLNGEALLMCRRGDAPVLDELRDFLREKYPQIRIVDLPHYYDAEVFNTCEHSGSVLLTLSIWKDVHPALVTIPVDWEFRIPRGLMHAEHPGEAAAAFLKAAKKVLKTP